MPRVLQTSAVLAALAWLLAPPLQERAMTASLSAGLLVAALIWLGARRVGGAVGQQRLRAVEWAQLAVVYLGKYAVAAVIIWSLQRHGWLRPLGFTAGFCLPMTVALLKAVGRSALPAELDPVPVYQRARKVAAGER